MSSTKTNINSIILCLEQKRIFVKDILDITKQIEVQSRQEEIQMEDLIEQRQARLDRIKKCDGLIEDRLKSFEDTSQRDKWEKIINGKGDDLKNDDEQKAFALMLSIKEILQRITEIDKKAKENLQNQYDEVKRHLTDLRKNASNSANMFNF